jgi:hypothetical protein
MLKNTHTIISLVFTLFSAYVTFHTSSSSTQRPLILGPMSSASNVQFLLSSSPLPSILEL